MKIVPLGPGFAAELRGVTIHDVAASDAAYATVRAAFEEHSVLVFRDQNVTDEAQLAFSRRFGPLEVTKVGSKGYGTNLVILKTLDDKGDVVLEDHRLALENKANQLWHTDSPFKRVPALASVLSSRIIPGWGARPSMSPPGSPSTASIRRCNGGWKIPSPGTNTPIRAARSRPTSPARRSGRRCRRNAGVLFGRTRSMTARRCTWPRTPTRSRAWSRKRRGSCSPS